MYTLTLFALFFALFASYSNGLPTLNKGGNKFGKNIDEQGIWFEGDIRGFTGKNGIIGDFMRWGNKTVIFNIDPSFDENAINLILGAMVEISQKTCIQFKERTNEIAYAQFFNGSPGTGCYAYVGRLGFYQAINLEPGCVRHGTIVHEILHTVGFFHEQSREDRDDYVDIIYDNVEFGKEHNFFKLISNAYGVPYDYGSLMHYSRTSFSQNGLPTIVPKDESAEIGQRIGMSPSDALKVNLMYEC